MKTKLIVKWIMNLVILPFTLLFLLLSALVLSPFVVFAGLCWVWDWSRS